MIVLTPATTPATEGLGIKDWIPGVQILVTIVGMYIGPKLAIHYSLKQFRSQKWWERKAEVYHSLMGHLAILKHAIRLSHERVLHIIELTPERLIEVMNDYNQARQDLEREATAATLLLDADTKGAVANLINTLEEQKGDWLEQNEKHWDAIDECIKIVEKNGLCQLQQ